MVGAVAVIGMACRLPGARGYDEFWTNLQNADNHIRQIPADRWDVEQFDPQGPDAGRIRDARWGGLLDQVELFDNRFFGISAREARNMDPQQRLLLEESWHCLEDAGLPHETLRSRVTSVYVGVMTIDYHQNVTSTPPDSYACLGNYVGILANRLSNFHGWRGESFALDAACAGSLTALHQARRALLAGECDYALVAGVSLIINPWHYVSFARSRMLSATGECRTFDRDANGYVPGEGVSVMLLCREEDARRDGARVHGRVIGTATGHVGASDSITAPSVAAQRRVIEDAARSAGIDLSTVSYIEAHGTGTPLGDPIEVAALTEALSDGAPRDSPCWIGSVKTSIGHLEAAAGLAGVTKILLMMRHRMIVPTRNLSHVNPLINFRNGMLRPATACVAWEGQTLRAGVSGFGFGGTNAHAIIESPAREPGLPSHDEVSLPFVLSAASPDSFRALWDDWRKFVGSPAFEAASLRDILGTLACGRAHLPYRFAAMVPDRIALRSLFDQAAPQPVHATTPPRILVLAQNEPAAADRIALLRRLGVRPIAVVGEGVADSSLARYDPVSQRMHLPFALDGTYLAALRDAMGATDVDGIEDLLVRARDLLASNFTFRGILGEWQRAIGDIFKWIETPPIDPNSRRQLVLCLVAATRRLARRWSLDAGQDAPSEAWNEIAGLIAEGLLREHEAVALLDADTAALDRLAATLAERALVSGPPAVAPVLQAHTAERSAVVEMPVPPSTLSVDIRALGRIGGLAELWQAGAPIDWSALDASHRVVSLPLYPFDGQRHWIDLHQPVATPVVPPMPDDAALLDRLDSYAAHRLFVALERAGAITPLGIGMTRADIARRCLRLPGYAPLLDACLEILGRHGLVALDGAQVRALTERAAVIAAAQAIRAGLRSGEGKMTGLLDAVDRCVGALPSVLAGDQPAEDVLFPATDTDLIDRLLYDLPGDRACLDLTAASVADAVAHRLREVPDQLVRIIEIGAGTGIATARVIATLVPYGAHVDYVCTDRSATLLAVARARVVGGPIMPEFTRLDPAAALGRFDIALAVNARHARGSVGERLRQVRSLLRTGGVLIVNEPTRSCDVLTVTLGLLAGWWDRTAAPLTPEDWRISLRDDFREVSLSGSPSRAVLVARCLNHPMAMAMAMEAEPTVAQTRPQPAPPPAVRQEPAPPMPTPAPANDHALLALICDAVARAVEAEPATITDDARFVDLGVDSLAASDLIMILTEMLGRTVSPHIIDDHPTPRRLARHLAGQGSIAEPPENVIPIAPTVAASPPLAATIRAVIAIVTEGDPAAIDDTRRFIDLGVDSILAGEAVLMLSERLGRTLSPDILNDHPTITALARYLDTTAAPSPAAALSSATATTRVWRVGRAGDLGSLHGHDTPRRSPGPGEVEIGTEAVSLNFRDVMEALARLGTKPAPLGLEFAGHVVAIGPGVTGFSIGDPVLGLQVGSLARHVVTPASLLAPLPPGLTLAEAASIPIVFLTASWTLERIGRLGPNQSVLIHAATGGVGLAAIQIARLAGATVLATAGSPEKRAFLNELGIACVADSRDLSFADAVRQATGGAGVDVVLNCLAGAMTDAGLGLVRPGGTFIEIGKTDLRDAADHPNIRYTVFDLLAEIDRDPALVGRRLGALLDRFDSGELTAIPIRTFPFAEASDALRFLARARHIGKVVLSDAVAAVPVPRPVVERPLPIQPPPVAAPPVVAPIVPTPTASPITDARAEPIATPVIETRDEPIAIVGMAGCFPGAPDIGAFWRLLRDGIDAVGSVPPGRWDKREFAAHGVPGAGEAQHRAGGFLADAECFDAAFFGISPREALLMDPQQRVILEQTWLALTDAGIRPRGGSQTRTGVFIGASASDYAQKAALLGLPIDRPSLLAQMPSSLSARLAYLFDLKGPALTVDMGCASAIAAIKLAVDALRRGEVEVAVAGAVAVQSTPQLAVMADQAEILAQDGRCRSFAANAAGLGLSEGAGVIVLRRLSDATARGDTIHAVIHAAAVSQNGATNGISAPSVTAQTTLARDTFAAAGIAPAAVSYIEAHGVGTKAGDTAEVTALAEVFGTDRALPIGSVKSNIGHTLAAAGMAGLFKLVLQLRHGLLAPSLHAGANPLPALSGGGLTVNTRLTPWATPRLAALNAFAINGSNGFMLVEEAPTPAIQAPVVPPCGALLLIADRTEAALRRRLADLSDWLDGSSVSLPDLAGTLNAAPGDLSWRAAFVASDLDTFRRQLRDGAGAAIGQARPQDPATSPVFAEMAARLCAEAAQADASVGRTRLLAVARLFVDGTDVVAPVPPGTRRVGLMPPHRFERQRFWPSDSDAVAPAPVETIASEISDAPASVDIPSVAGPRGEDRRLSILRDAAAAVLRLPVSGISDQSALPRLGLDSLLAFELRARLAADLGIAPEPAALLADQPLAALALTLLTEAGHSVTTIQPNIADRFEPFPLTDIQLAYWLGRTSGFALGGACHVYWEFTAGPERNPDRLEAALNRLIAMHDMLRAVVLPDGTQRVLADVQPYVIERYGADGLPALRSAMTRETFDPTRWPLFRVAFSQDEATTRVHLGIDLLIIDVPSLAVLLGEWGRLCAEPGAVLPAPGITFRDYVLHQRREEDGPAFEAAEAYWAALAPSLPPAPVLPDMKPLDARAEWAWNRHRDVLDRDDWARLRSHARAAGVTPVAVLVTAFAEVLARWAAARRFTVNLTVNDRQPIHPDIAAVIGDFTSTVLLGLDLDTPVPFADRARGTGGDLASHLGHARYTGVRVLQQRGNGRSDLMPVVFTSMLGYGALSGPLGRLEHGATRTPQVWLDAQVMEDDGALVFTWDAIDALFPDGLMGGMFAAWGSALRALAADAAVWERPLSAWLEDAEKARRLRRNATDHPLPEGLLHEPFLRQALAHPDRVAVIGPDGTVTHGDLLRHASAVAVTLGDLPADRLVAVSLPKGWRQIAAVIGVLMAGGAYLPIDPTLPEARRHHLVRRVEASVVLTLDGLGLAWPEATRVIAMESIEPTSAAIPVARAKSHDLAYVIFTSGSTGEPKGVMIEHRAALNTVLDVNDRYCVTASDRVLGLSSLGFDLSVYDVFGVLGAGGAIVLPDPRSAADPAHLADLIRSHGVTIWNSVPMFVQLFLEAQDAGDALTRLRLVMMSGDWIPIGLPPRLHQANPALDVISLGGATEASIWSIAYPIGAPDPAWASIPYGFPMRNQRFHVLDERLDDCPDWIAGELFIAGIGLARGYWRDEAITESRFITHPVSGERLYRTGDLGRYRDDGVIEFLGRNDGQVKIGGYRIELGEIEATLARNPKVRHAAVVVRTDADGHRFLMAFHVSDGVDAAELRDHVGRTLPGYMVPAAFQRLETMPLNANEKVDRKALVAWRAPEAAVETKSAGPAELESQILAIWRDVLRNPLLPPDGKLFEHGAHSFHAVDANTRINRALGVGCTVTDIFEFATVRALAAALAERGGSPQPAAGPVATALPAPLSRVQRRRQFRAGRPA